MLGLWSRLCKAMTPNNVKRSEQKQTREISLEQKQTKEMNVNQNQTKTNEGDKGTKHSEEQRL